MSVFPLNQNNVNDLELVDKHGRRWELKLAGDIRSMQEIPSSPSTMAISAGGQRYGDWEPGFSHVEQRSWIGGRAIENFSDDTTGYFDSKDAWSLTDGKLFPSAQWKFAKGLRNTDSYMPGSVKWVALRGTNLYLTTSFAASANYDADKAYLWIRRRGSPGTLTVTLRSDDTGPDAVLQTVTKTITNITDTVSELVEFDWTSTQALTSGTTYWICAQGASTDNSTNHWEIGVDADTSSAKSSADGSTWADASLKLYYRIVDADLSRRFFFFMLEGALYAVSQYQDSTASEIYINGDRGTATSGASATLTNSGAAFGTDDRFVGARVKIIAGTGNGQNREITAHTGTQLTVSPAWKVNPDNTSRYVIYATDQWKKLSESTGLGKVVNKPLTAGRFVFFPQGSGKNIRKMRINGSTHEFNDSGTDKADFLALFYSGTTPKIWRAQNDLTDVTVSYASVPSSWGSSSASFSSNISVGSPDYLITYMRDYNNTLWVFKEDSIWLYNGNGFDKFSLAMGDNPSEKNGLAVATQDLVLYFSFLDSVEYTNGGNTTDFGPWLGTGLPDDRSGNVSVLVPILAWLCAGLDADTGTSSVLINNDISGAVGGWHELLRGFKAGKRIQDICYQPNMNDRNKLWVDIGGEIIYQDFPMNTLNPLRDSGFSYQHECVVVSSTHDLNFSDLPKFYKELVVVSEKMASGMEICVDYQTDENVGTNNWIYAGSIYRSPKGSVTFNEGGRRKFRYRLRINTNNDNAAPVVEAVILKAYARTPVKRQWNLKVKADGNLYENTNQKLKDLYKWLWANCQEANGVMMHSDLEEIDGVWVVIEPPTVLRSFKDSLSALWGGTFVLTLREA